MIREICKDEAFLAQKAEPATPDDIPIAADLLETLEHHVIPVFIPQHRLGLSPQFGARVQMLRQPCPASGMANHFCAGQPSQHLRHMIGEGKAVAQHENTHHGDPFL